MGEHDQAERDEARTRRSPTIAATEALAAVRRCSSRRSRPPVVVIRRERKNMRSRWQRVVKRDAQACGVDPIVVEQSMRSGNDELRHQQD